MFEALVLSQHSSGGTCCFSLGKHRQHRGKETIRYIFFSFLIFIFHRRLITPLCFLPPTGRNFCLLLAVKLSGELFSLSLSLLSLSLSFPFLSELISFLPFFSSNKQRIGEVDGHYVFLCQPSQKL